MGTAAPNDDEKVHGVIQYANKTVTVVSETAYGHNRGSMYPLALVLTATVAIIGLLLADADLLLGLVGLVSLALLGIWVGGRGR